MLNFKKIRKKNMTLIGLMGSGKSIIGKELSTYYGIKLYDSDNEIEKKVGQKISDIFKNKGEIYFRAIEEKVCLDLLEKENCIISLGGGGITSIKTRNKIEKNSFSIYLKVDVDILVKRLSNSIKRPLLKNKDKKNKLNEIYKERKKYYNDADLIIENNFNKKNVLENIKKSINF